MEEIGPSILNSVEDHNESPAESLMFKPTLKGHGHLSLDSDLETILRRTTLNVHST